MTQDIHLIHASLDTFMSDEKNVADVETVASLDPDFAVFTEIGQNTVVSKVKRAVGDKYQVVNPDNGDILFIVRRDIRILASGGPLAIPGQPGPARLGGHGPRHNSFVQMQFGKDVLTHTGVHFVTAHPDHEHNTGDRRDQQFKQARLVGEQMAKYSKGRHLATGSGDINASLPHMKPMQAIFDEFGLTTTVEETGVQTPTHGNARLDYVWTSDRDGRLSVPTMKVRRGPRFNSDHDPVDVHLSVKA